MSKTRSLHHIVFATRRRQPSIPEEYKRELYAYIFGIIKQHRCFLIRINGIADHIHILVDIHPTVALSSLVKEIKQCSSLWLKENSHFPKFGGWAEGFFAVSIGEDGVESCKAYIINQENHHLNMDFREELQKICAAYKLTLHPNDLE